MVEILPRERTFGESMMPALENAIGAFGQQRAAARDEGIINSFNPEDAPLVQMQKFAKLSAQKQQALSPLMTQLVKGQQQQAKGLVTQKKEAAEKQEAEAGIKNALTWLEDNIKYTGSTSIPGTKSFMGAGPTPLINFLPTKKVAGAGLNREAVEKREGYNTTGFWVTDQIFTRFNKGTVSAPKLETIKNDLSPRAELSERENKARVASLRRIANLPRDVSKTEFDKAVDREVKIAKKAEGNNVSSKKAEAPQGTTKVVGPNGQEYDIPNDQVQAALANGGKLA